MQALQDARALSKRQRKRLEQIAQRKRKEARRSSLYETLAQQRLLPGTQALLRSSKAFSMGVRGRACVRSTGLTFGGGGGGGMLFFDVPCLICLRAICTRWTISMHPPRTSLL